MFFQTLGLRTLACIHFLKLSWIYYGLAVYLDMGFETLNSNVCKGHGDKEFHEPGFWYVSEQCESFAENGGYLQSLTFPLRNDRHVLRRFVETTNPRPNCTET